MFKQDMARMAIRAACSSVLSIGMLAVMPGTAAATPVGGPQGLCNPAGYPNPNNQGYDNTNPQANGLFTDLRHPTQINSVDDPEVPDPSACMLELTGSVGSAGDMWITLVDPPAFPGPNLIVGCATLSAEVLIKKFDNRKAVGFVANYDAASGKGLFLGLYDNGNTDALTLSTFEATGATAGKLTSTVVTLPLGSSIKENEWYSLRLQNLCVVGTQVTGTAVVAGDNLIPTQMPINASLLPITGILPVGQIGIAGYAKSSFVDSNVRSFVFGNPI